MPRSHPRSLSKNPIWLWPNLLGLDAPLVAICWQGFFANIFSVPVPIAVYLILFLSTWTIYLVDRLIDVTRSEVDEISTARHQFTSRNVHKLSAVAMIVLLMNITLIAAFLPFQLFLAGAALSLLLLIYYALRFGKRLLPILIIPREIICGILFALGAALPIIIYGLENEILREISKVVFYYAAVAGLSCIAISLWEAKLDTTSDEYSITKINRLLPYFSYAVIAVISVGIWLAWTISLINFFPAIFSAIVLLLLNHTQKRMNPDVSRALADGILLTPLVVIFVK